VRGEKKKRDRETEKDTEKERHTHRERVNTFRVAFVLDDVLRHDRGQDSVSP